MERRDAVKYISLLMGGTLIGAEVFLSGCKSATGKAVDWAEEDIAYLDEIGETILPRTSTPGAKDVNAGKFMTVMVTDCYEEGDQKIFRKGMDDINAASKEKFDKDFMKLTPAQRKELLTVFDEKGKKYQKEVKEFNLRENNVAKEEVAKGNKSYTKKKKPADAFTMMKQLTLLGFFTSEAGATKAVRYLYAPGRYEGCVPYKKGDKLIV